MSSPVIDYYKCRKSSLVVYPSFEQLPVKERDLSYLAENREKPKFDGQMSKMTRKKITDIMSGWLQHIAVIMADKKQDRSQHWQYMTFITLTLCSEQVHSDQEVKRLMLNRFLIELQRYHGVKKYLWVAEKQKNGNIHFHICIDQPIWWTKIRDRWNAIQASFGYVDSFENKYKHRNPNSTDIHALDNVDDPEAYLVKYLCKEDYPHLVTGRLWSCSRCLRNVTPYGDVMDEQVRYIMDAGVDRGELEKVVMDYATVYVGPVQRLLCKHSRWHAIQIRGYYRKLFDSESPRQTIWSGSVTQPQSRPPQKRGATQLRLAIR